MTIPRMRHLILIALIPLVRIARASNSPAPGRRGGVQHRSTPASTRELYDTMIAQRPTAVLGLGASISAYATEVGEIHKLGNLRVVNKKPTNVDVQANAQIRSGC
jgi:hypothetical protein